MVFYKDSSLPVDTGRDSDRPLSENYFMPKKKKRKTRKEKQFKDKRRFDYIKSIDKINSNIEGFDKEVEKDSGNILNSDKLDSEEAVESQREEFTISNIKRALVYAFIFSLIIIIFYFLEQKFHFFSEWANSLMNIFI